MQSKELSSSPSEVSCFEFTKPRSSLASRRAVSEKTSRLRAEQLCQEVQDLLPQVPLVADPAQLQGTLGHHLPLCRAHARPSPPALPPAHPNSCLMSLLYIPISPFHSTPSRPLAASTTSSGCISLPPTCLHMGSRILLPAPVQRRGPAEKRRVKSPPTHIPLIPLPSPSST